MTVLLISVAALANMAVGFAISRIVGAALPGRQPVDREAALPAGRAVDKGAAGAGEPSQPGPQAGCTVSAVLPGLRDAIPKMKAALSQELSDPYCSIKEKHLTALAQMSQELLGAPDDPAKDSAAFIFRLDQFKAQFESSVSNLSVVSKGSNAKTTCDVILSEIEKIDSVLKMLNPCN